MPAWNSATSDIVTGEYGTSFLPVRIAGTPDQFKELPLLGVWQAAPNGTAAAPAHSFVNDTNTGMYRLAEDTLMLVTGGVDRFRISSNGAVGCNVTPVARFHTRGLALDTLQLVAQFDCTNAAGSDVHGLEVRVDPIGNLVQFSSTGSNAGSFSFLTGGTDAFRVDNLVGIRPGVDNSLSCGTAAFRWTQLFAATGTINTSDERDKVWRGAMTAAERAAARAIIGELGFYQWSDSVEEKGDLARLHFGARAQRVWAIMAEHRLIDPIDDDGRPGKTPYAFLCYDMWPDYFEDVKVQLDDEGNVDPKAVPEQRLVRAAGNRFGLRIDQLSLFLIAAVLGGSE